MQPYTCPCLRRLPCWYAALQHEPLVDGKLVHSVRRGSVANKEASSHLSPYRRAGMILPDSDLFSSPASFFLPDPSVPRLLDDLSEASVSLLWRRYREEV